MARTSVCLREEDSPDVWISPQLCIMHYELTPFRPRLEKISTKKGMNRRPSLNLFYLMNPLSQVFHRFMFVEGINFYV